MQYIGPLRSIYTFYSMLGLSDVTSGTSVMTRMQFWRLLLDCKLHNHNMTVAQMDKLTSTFMWLAASSKKKCVCLLCFVILVSKICRDTYIVYILTFSCWENMWTGVENRNTVKHNPSGFQISTKENSHIIHGIKFCWGKFLHRLSSWPFIFTMKKQQSKTIYCYVVNVYIVSSMLNKSALTCWAFLGNCFVQSNLNIMLQL